MKTSIISVLSVFLAGLHLLTNRTLLFTGVLSVLFSTKTSYSQCVINENVSMTDSIGSGVDYIGQSFIANVSTIDTVGIWLWPYAGPNQVKFGIAPDDGAGNADETAVLWMSGLISLPVAGQWFYIGGLGIPVTSGLLYHVLIDTTGGGNYGLGYSTTGFTSTGENLKYSVDNGVSWTLWSNPMTIYVSGDCTPPSSISVTNDTSICTGNSVALTVTVTDSAGFPAPYTFLWTPADSLSCTACQSPVANPDSTTTYMVMVTDSAGTQDSAFVTITVYSLPPLADAGLDTVICERDSIQLNASGGAYYSWSPAAGLSDTGIANPYANPVITTAYEVTVSNVCGGDVDSVTVTVNPAPTVDAGVDTSFCYGESGVGLEALGAISFVWSPAAGLSCTSCAKPTANPSSTTTYYVTGTDANGCTNTDSIIISVSGVPIAATSSTDSICQGSSAQLNVDALVTGACNDYNIDSIPFAPIPGAGTPVFLADDETSIAFPIGFTFNFYCNDYSQFYISSNGFLGFSSGMPNGCCSGQLLPNPAVPNNLIAFAWSDLYPPGNGSIDYFTTGTAPNRKLVVNFTDIPYCCGATPEVSTQVILYETTNTIEIHTDFINNINSGTMGIENDSGTVAHVVSGRNSATWSAANEGIRFTSITGGTLDSTATISWSPTTGLSNPNIANPVASPASTTTYIVSATVGSCSNFDTITIYVDTSSFITATPVTPICEGDSVQLSVTGSAGLPDDSTWIYVWSPGNTLTDSTAAAPLAFPASATTYQVTVSNLCGVYTDTVTVTVNPAPTVDAGADTSYCFGLSGVGLEALGPGGTSFVWSPAAGLTCTACTKPTASPSSTTTYYVTGTSINGCTNTDSIRIIVNGIPVAATSSTDSICPGDSAQLNVDALIMGACNDYNIDSIPFAPIPGSGTFITLNDDEVSTPLPVGFNFNFYCIDYSTFYISSNGFITFNNNPNSGCCSGQSLPDPAVPNNLIAFAWDDLYPPGNGSIDYFTTGTAPNRKLVVNFTDIPYCCGATPEVSTQVILYETTNTIEIHTAYINNISPGTMGLENDSGTVAHVVPGRNSATWSANNEGIRFTSITGGTLDTTATISWSPSTGLSNPNIANPVASPSATTTYVVTVGDTASCCKTDTITVNVDNTITVITPSSDVGICTGDSVQLYATSNNPIVSWSWSPAAGLSDTAIANPVANPSSTTTYTVTATNALGCQISNDVTVSVAPYPVASFTHSESALTVSFTNSSVNADTWEWDFGNNYNSGLLNPIYTYDSAGVYNVCLTVTNACTSITTCEPITVIDCVLPLALFGYSVSGFTADFTDQSINATGWSWDFGDSSAINTNQNPTHTYADSGTYNVCLTATNACGSNNKCNAVSITSTTGISENHLENGVNIYPNPNSGEFMVEIYDLRFLNYDLKIYDVLGREILKSKIKNQKSKIDLSGYPAGIYNVQLLNDKKMINKKIIIE